MENIRSDRKSAFFFKLPEPPSPPRCFAPSLYLSLCHWPLSLTLLFTVAHPSVPMKLPGFSLTDCSGLNRRNLHRGPDKKQGCSPSPSSLNIVHINIHINPAGRRSEINHLEESLLCPLKDAIHPVFDTACNTWPSPHPPPLDSQLEMLVHPILLFFSFFLNLWIVSGIMSLE